MEQSNYSNYNIQSFIIDTDCNETINAYCILMH